MWVLWCCWKVFRKVFQLVVLVVLVWVCRFLQIGVRQCRLLLVMQILVLWLVRCRCRLIKVQLDRVSIEVRLLLKVLFLLLMLVVSGVVMCSMLLVQLFRWICMVCIVGMQFSMFCRVVNEEVRVLMDIGVVIMIMKGLYNVGNG